MSGSAGWKVRTHDALTRVPGARDVVRRWDRIRADERALAALTASAHNDRARAERIIQMIIDRHFAGAVPPPGELRAHVGPDDSLIGFWNKGITSSALVLEHFGDAPSGPVLDWGCGSGRTLVWLRGYPAWREAYHGCDVDEDAIAWLKAQFDEPVSVCGDAPPLPYADATFAGLFSFSVLTHIPGDVHAAWWAEIARVLRPGGRALVTTRGMSKARDRYGADAVRAMETTGTVWYDEPGHYKSSGLVTEEFTRAAIGDRLAVERFVEAGYGPQDVWWVSRP